MVLDLIRDSKYRDFVRTFDCCVRQNCSPHIIDSVREVHCHHISAYGVGTKCSDLETVSMCLRHHNEIHHIGRKQFNRKYPGKIEARHSEILIEALDVFPEYKDEILDLLDKMGEIS